MNSMICSTYNQTMSMMVVSSKTPFIVHIILCFFTSRRLWFRLSKIPLFSCQSRREEWEVCTLATLAVVSRGRSHQRQRRWYCRKGIHSILSSKAFKKTIQLFPPATDLPHYQYRYIHAWHNKHCKVGAFALIRQLASLRDSNKLRASDSSRHVTSIYRTK